MGEERLNTDSVIELLGRYSNIIDKAISDMLDGIHQYLMAQYEGACLAAGIGDIPIDERTAKLIREQVKDKQARVAVLSIKRQLEELRQEQMKVFVGCRRLGVFYGELSKSKGE